MKLVFVFLIWFFSAWGISPAPAFLTPLLVPPERETAALPYTHSLDEDLIALFSSTYSKHAHDLWKPKNEALATGLAKNVVAGKANKALIEAVYRDLTQNAVAKEQNAANYDPNGDLGFCFGRAMWVHHLLRKRQIAQGDIAKLFVVGKLSYRDLMWDFHVTTLVRAQDKTWWAIDSLYDKPLPAVEWMQRAQKLGANQKRPELFFAFTDPRKFQAGHGAYRVDDLKNPSLYPYFRSLFGAF